MQQEFDKLEIAILYMLYDKEKFTALTSCQIKDFLTDEGFLSRFKVTTSYNTMVRRVKSLLEQEYISFGYKEGNAQTYFLNTKGVECIEHELMENGIIENDNEDIEGGI